MSVPATGGQTLDSGLHEHAALLDELTALRHDLTAFADRPRSGVDHMDLRYRASGRNLMHYVAMRRRDLRSIQVRLAALGLSSLGRCEAHVLATIDAVVSALRSLTGEGQRPAEAAPAGISFEAGERLLREHAEALLGPAPRGREVRIMVTMPSEAASDSGLVERLLERGMDCMRINCAHDDEVAWGAMIANLRRAERVTGRRAKVIMDLAGPKLRTGPLEPGPAVCKVRPERDLFGRVTAPARIWLTDEAWPAPPPSPADLAISVSGPWLEAIALGESIRVRDARDAARELRVVDLAPGGVWAETQSTIYFENGAILRRRSAGPEDPAAETAVCGVPAREQAIRLARGDRLIITRDQRPGRLATFDSAGRVLTPASIGCTLPEALDEARPGEPIWLDDGKIGGVIERVEPDHVVASITHARAGGDLLRSDKGINLPETTMRIPAMTAKDRQDLAFIAEHADIVALSFANATEDVESLMDSLRGLGERRPAIVLKIETRRGFNNLPALLRRVMRWPSCGIMIARGDLAVECGFERLAEVQEEMLWMCEAAHVPVIWATQVLEQLAKEGLPSRAEITDAAMAHRAECVMLNKGPHVTEAMMALDDILCRMQAHQTKKRSMLRELHIAKAFPLE